MKLFEVGVFDMIFADYDAAVAWDGENWKCKCKLVRAGVVQLEADRLRNVLSCGKHQWLIRVLPRWDAPRPLNFLPGSSRRHKVLKRWLISEHDLVVETGRYARTPRHNRLCEACLLLGQNHIQDEAHMLGATGDCPIAWVERVAAKHELDMMLMAEEVASMDTDSLQHAVEQVHLLSEESNRLAWSLVASFLVAVEDELEVAK